MSNWYEEGNPLRDGEDLHVPSRIVANVRGDRGRGVTTVSLTDGQVLEAPFGKVFVWEYKPNLLADDPELVQLLAEEEEIERRLAAHHDNER